MRIPQTAHGLADPVIRQYCPQFRDSCTFSSADSVSSASRCRNSSGSWAAKVISRRFHLRFCAGRRQAEPQPELGIILKQRELACAGPRPSYWWVRRGRQVAAVNKKSNSVGGDQQLFAVQPGQQFDIGVSPQTRTGAGEFKQRRDKL